MSPRHIRRYMKQSKVYSIKKPIYYFKNRIKNYSKKLLSNSNPTNGTKKSNAGHVQTGLIKVLILLAYFFGRLPNGVPNNCIFYKRQCHESCSRNPSLIRFFFSLGTIFAACLFAFLVISYKS